MLGLNLNLCHFFCNNMWKIVIGETAHLCSRLTRAFSERPEISTELIVGFFSHWRQGSIWMSQRICTYLTEPPLSANTVVIYEGTPYKNNQPHWETTHACLMNNCIHIWDRYNFLMVSPVHSECRKGDSEHMLKTQTRICLYSSTEMVRYFIWDWKVCLFGFSHLLNSHCRMSGF